MVLPERRQHPIRRRSLLRATHFLCHPFRIIFTALWCFYVFYCFRYGDVSNGNGAYAPPIHENQGGNHTGASNPHYSSTVIDGKRNDFVSPQYDRSVETVAFNTTQQYIKYNKRGRAVVKAITRVRLEDLTDLPESLLAKANATSPALPDPNRADKEPILRMLRQAGITDVDPRVITLLPSWRDVTDLYGDDVPIVGLDEASCRWFRDTVPLRDAYLGAAGLFNTGTNALTYYLRANLLLPFRGEAPIHRDGKDSNRQGILTQVPWDKHWFARLRNHHTVDLYANVTKAHVLPIVMIRDPLSWSQSMCQQPYLVRWRGRTVHCPDWREPVLIPHMTGGHHWDSLWHLWNDWYRDYWQHENPRLIVRFEDLLWRPQQVLRAIQSCVGATWTTPGTFYYVVDRSKWEHVKTFRAQSNMVSAMIKHGTPSQRVRNLSLEELEQARQILDPQIMELFGYSVPKPS
jgi:hypothetical protein